MTEYSSNSHKSKELEKKPEKKVEKVISGKAKTKKKSEFAKFTDIFITEDINNVKSYIFMDVLIPAMKKAISDIVTNGIDMILYGESGGTKANRSTASKISYQKYYDRSSDYKNSGYTRTRTGYSYDDIIVESRGEAEDILTRMEELIATYSIASVADLYDLAGISCNYTDNKYGWTNLSSAHVQRVRDGYLLKLPKALPID